jgi:hypothetical protein
VRHGCLSCLYTPITARWGAPENYHSTAERPGIANENTYFYPLLTGENAADSGVFGERSHNGQGCLSGVRRTKNRAHVLRGTVVADRWFPGSGRIRPTNGPPASGHRSDGSPRKSAAGTPPSPYAALAGPAAMIPCPQNSLRSSHIVHDQGLLLLLSAEFRRDLGWLVSAAGVSLSVASSLPAGPHLEPNAISRPPMTKKIPARSQSPGLA